MKKINPLFLILFLFNLSIGQIKTVYVNENLKLISEDEFNKTDNNNDFLYNQYYSDTLIIKTKAKRKIKGNIDDSLRIEIKNYINNIEKNDDKILENDIIVINYYPGLDYCNKSAGNEILINRFASYTRRIKKIKNVKQFYFYKDIGNTKKYGKKLVWFKDYYNLFEKIFFKIHYPCGSYVIIFPDNTFLSYFGEYNLDSIFDELKFKEKFDNKDNNN